MIEFSGERWVEARCEQVWMVVDDAGCRSRWLSFHDQINEVLVSEPSKIVSWNTQELPSLPHASNCESCLTIELIPEGAGTRVRIYATREPAGRLQEIAMKMTTQKAFERNIRRSLEQLAQMLSGRSSL
ncbi:MAG: SRPBCC domain-containing protein [Solirubrobacterales bacterium]